MGGEPVGCEASRARLVERLDRLFDWRAQSSFISSRRSVKMPLAYAWSASLHGEGRTSRGASARPAVLALRSDDGLVDVVCESEPRDGSAAESPSFIRLCPTCRVSARSSPIPRAGSPLCGCDYYFGAVGPLRPHAIPAGFGPVIELTGRPGRRARRPPRRGHPRCGRCDRSLVASSSGGRRSGWSSSHAARAPPR